MEENKIAAVVATFNRKRLLLACLNSLENQTYPLDAIFIIDGPSTDGTPQALLDNEYINELPPTEYLGYSWEGKNCTLSRNKTEIIIYYIRLYSDLGGSGSFHEGIQKAYERGYKWIWTMDDDAKASENALEELIKYVDLPYCIAVAPTVKNPDGVVSRFHRGFISFKRIFPTMQLPLKDEMYNANKPSAIEFASFVGLLIKSDAVAIVGVPKNEFFIYHDDVEYSLRLITIGCIYLVPSSIMIHEEEYTSALIKKNIFGRVIYRIPYNKLWKNYFFMRNLIYLGNTYSLNKFSFLIELLKRWMLSILLVIFFDDNKLLRMWFITSAYFDGLKGKFDNDKPKKIINMRR
jgi:rhamnopyranosyl-N-acetylglucosaminyl-diphospho-decaprenol beta-1,3/1,4-galactofuranosyltransferase